MFHAVREKGSAVVAGVDPHPELLPGPPPASAGEAAIRIVEYFGRWIPLVAPHAVAVKLQVAFFEALGADGWGALAELAARARAAGLLVLADAKRGDIGTTATAYARAFLAREILPGVAGPLRADAVTVSPYLGSDGVRPFVETARAEGGGLFVLVKTSNPSSAELQDLPSGSGPVHEQVARLVKRWGEGLAGTLGYSLVGAVAGATHGGLAARLRPLLAGVPVLLAGWGAQGGGPEQVRGWFDAAGLGAVVAASRSLAFPWKAPPRELPGTDAAWEAAVSHAAVEMKDAVNSVRCR